MFLKILISQARHKWVVAALIFLAMTALVTLYVYSSNTSQFANRSMQLVMKNMGHNLLILPEEADPWTVYSCGDGQTLFPEETTRRMSKQLGFSSRYYVSVLQERIDVDGCPVVLTGIDPVGRPDETAEKANMVPPLAEDQARLGQEAARRLGKQAGDTIEILGEPFCVVEVLPPKAALDDCRVYVNLARCQKLLGREGRIHYILAFLCLHSGSLAEALEIQQQRLSAEFPGFRQIARMDIAEGRHLARITTQESLRWLLTLVAAATVIIIAVTGLQEVHDRRHETGIMIAMGVSHAYVVWLYLAKTLVLAVAAAVCGFLIGSLLAVRLTAPFLVVNTNPVMFLWGQLPAAVALTCAVALLAEIVPVVKLFLLEPSAILVEDS